MYKKACLKCEIIYEASERAGMINFFYQNKRTKDGFVSSCKGCVSLYGKTEPRMYYGIYKAMVSRCYSPRHASYKDYGAKGVTVAGRWLGSDGFRHFKEDMGDRPSGLTLDRIDGSKGYGPDNCRWADRFTQSINRGITKNNTSGYIGVRRIKNRPSCWKAIIKVNKKDIFLGSFKNIEDAARAYDKAAKSLHGPKAKQNFPS